jgi:hypothetical protein
MTRVTRLAPHSATVGGRFCSTFSTKLLGIDNHGVRRCNRDADRLAQLNFSALRL